MAWKMFVIIFAFVLTNVAAEIPPYMHICGRKNPNIDKCITNSINGMKDLICKGIPELQSPPLEPFHINQIIISEENNAKVYFKDVLIMGFCNFTISYFHVNLDLDNIYFDINILLERSFINGIYDFNIHILVPFVHKGPISFISDNVIGRARFYMKTINKGDKKYTYVSKINLNLDIKLLSTKFDTNENHSSQFNEILSTFLGSNQEEFIRRVTPLVEEEVSKRILLISNNILKHFTFDELYPDRV